MNRLTCSKCSMDFPDSTLRWRCECGGPLDLAFDAEFDFDVIVRRPADMWRYREALPIDDGSVVSLQEGFTPLTRIRIDGREILVKQDHLSPTGSYKDRGASVLISKAKSLGVDRVVEDSSGNAGCAVAAYCAHAGILSEIYVPESTSPSKLSQIESYGAKLNRVPGTREDTAHAAMEAAEGSFYASHSWNPYFFHGTKTFAYELCEQLNWRGPDVVVVPVGNGTLLLGCAIGFRELMKDQVIEKMPQLVGVQTQGCAPLYRAFVEGLESVPAIDRKSTIAEGIAIAEPIRGPQILREIRDSLGYIVVVDDILTERAKQQMARLGHYIEPTSAAAIAGLDEVIGKTPTEDVIVTTFTGHGLKAK